MGMSFSQLQPRELVEFKKLPTDVPLGDIDIPEKEENRRPTNVKWLVTMGVFMLVLIPFLIYTLYYSDIARLLYNYDKCGNICGRTNYYWQGIKCSGKDMTAYPYLQFEDSDSYTGPNLNDELVSDLKERKCVQTCKDGYTPIFGRCFKTSPDKYSLNAYPGHDVTRTWYEAEEIDLAVYFSSVKWQLIFSCLLSVLVSMGMVFMFRYAIAFVVWGILLGGLAALVVLVIFFWWFFASTTGASNEQQQNRSVGLYLAIIFTMLALTLGIVLIWCRKKIRLVILLYKETAKAVFDMPGLIAIPVVFAICLLVLSGLFALLTSFILSSGVLTLAVGDFYVYQLNPVMILTLVYNTVAFFWFSQFITGIQYMVVAGAVSKWYFAREKTLLRSPIFQSMSITFRYHLGTVAFGSMLLTIMRVIKAIILGLCRNERVRICVQCCLESVEDFFKFLSTNAYIVTALHGQAFLKSGKRAAKLIIQNINDIIAVNYIGDFVVGMAKILIVLVTVLLALAVFSVAPSPVYPDNNVFSLILIAVVSAVVACISFGVFETTVDTLFICYCEDNLLNDGMARPYYMTTNLREFVEESKKVYKKTA